MCDSVLDSLISYRVALRARSLGFDGPTVHYYHLFDDLVDAESSLEATGDLEPRFLNSQNIHRVACPTYGHLLAWLKSRWGFTCTSLYYPADKEFRVRVEWDAGVDGRQVLFTPYFGDELSACVSGVLIAFDEILRQLPVHY